MQRSEILAARKWDLTALYPDEAAWEGEYQALKEESARFAAPLPLTLDTAAASLDAVGDFERRLERLIVYAGLKRDENTADARADALYGRAQMLAVAVSDALSYLSPTLASWREEDLRAAAAMPQYRRHAVMLLRLIREKPHVLSAAEEKILARVSLFTDDFHQIFMKLDNADLKFEAVRDEKGELVPLSHGSYALLLQNPDADVRRRAFENYYAGYAKMRNTIAAAYAASVKKDCAMASIRNYPSAMQQALDAECIPSCVYDNLIDAVGGGTEAMHEYVRLRRRALGLASMHMYDMYVPITDGMQLQLDYDRAFDLVEEALRPLGEKYGAILHGGRTGGWVDVEETENKRSGAYSWGCYDAHPYVLLNYQPTIHDVFTIAHEMGHAIHSYLSNRSQCYEQAGYEIFVAEVASTVNEVLLLKHLLKKATGSFRIGLLAYYLDMFRTTLFRQTMFAEFEKFAHEQIESDKPLTAEAMDAAYMALNRRYYGDGVVHDAPIATEWCRIPHFYTPFYVYKYATGLTSAVNIAASVLADPEGFVPKYFRFLSAGGSLTPLEILNLVDVDLTTRAPFETAMREFDSTLAQLKAALQGGAQ